MLGKNVTRLLMSSHPPCQYIYNENLNVQQRNVNRKISGRRRRRGWSHLFCFAVRQHVPEDWRLQISEYNDAVIMEDIGIIPFIQRQGGADIFIWEFIYYVRFFIHSINCEVYIVCFCFIFFIFQRDILSGSFREIDGMFWLIYLPLNIKLQSLGNIKQPLPNLKPLRHIFAHRGNTNARWSF